MKLINLNIGIKINNTKKIINFFKNSNADIFAIQEIIRHLEKTAYKQYQSKADIEKALQKTHLYKFFGPLWITNTIRKNNKIYQNFGGLIEQGNEIISKYPIIEATNEYYYKHYCHALDWTNWEEEDHARAVQIIELKNRNKKFQILNFHGIWTENKKGDNRTMRQCEYLIKTAEKKQLPTIITGDFNLYPNSESIQLMNKFFINLLDKYNIKSTRPNFNDGTDKGNNIVDYIFVNKNIKVIDFKVINTNISDHLPLYLEFEIK